MPWYWTWIAFEKGCVLLIKNQSELKAIKYAKDQNTLNKILAQYEKAEISVVPSPKKFALETDLFQEYFQGRPVDFSPLKLDFSKGTLFQKKTWEVTQKIPYGCTETYKSLARKTNHKGYRSVGGALGKNPFLIAVPCHRVIRTNGDLGGFGAGLELKKYLLQLEDTPIHT